MFTFHLAVEHNAFNNCVDVQSLCLALVHSVYNTILNISYVKHISTKNLLGTAKNITILLSVTSQKNRGWSAWKCFCFLVSMLVILSIICRKQVSKWIKYQIKSSYFILSLVNKNDQIKCISTRNGILFPMEKTFWEKYHFSYRFWVMDILFTSDNIISQNSFIEQISLQTYNRTFILKLLNG